jgi:hypothetical protein
LIENPVDVSGCHGRDIGTAEGSEGIPLREKVADISYGTI